LSQVIGITPLKMVRNIAGICTLSEIDSLIWVYRIDLKNKIEIP